MEKEEFQDRIQHKPFHNSNPIPCISTSQFFPAPREVKGKKKWDFSPHFSPFWRDLGVAFPGPWIHPWAQPHPHFHGLIPGDKSSFSQGKDGSGSTLRAGFGGSQSSQNPHRPRWDFSSRQDKLGSNPAATKGKDKKQSPFLPPFPAAKIKKKFQSKSLCVLHGIKMSLF